MVYNILLCNINILCIYFFLVIVSGQCVMDMSSNCSLCFPSFRFYHRYSCYSVVEHKTQVIVWLPKRHWSGCILSSLRIANAPFLSSIPFDFNHFWRPSNWDKYFMRHRCSYLLNQLHGSLFRRNTTIIRRYTTD